MVDVIKVNGLIITWKAWVFTLGKTEEDTRENTKMIKSMGMVFTLGQIKDNIRVGGSKENNMALVHIQYLIKNLKTDYGKMEKELNGLMNSRLQKYSKEDLTLHIISRSLRVPIT